MDLSFLTPVYAEPGPVATVILASGKHTESAARELGLTWRHLADELAEAETSPETIAALEAEVDDVVAGTAPEGLVLAAAGGELLFRHELAAPPTATTATPGPLPHLTELVRQGSRTCPHVVVTVDRLGASIHAYGPLGEEVVSRGLTGDDFRLRKVKVGGWSHRRYLRRVEETWEANAELVAHDVSRIAQAFGAQLVLVAGDVRARQLVTDHLEPPVRDLVTQLDKPGDVEPAAEVIDLEVRTAARRAVDGVLEELRQELGRDGAGVAGLAKTCFALRKGQVRTLVLEAGFVARPPEVFVGSQATEVSPDSGDLDEPVRAAGDDAVVRASVGAGVEVVIAEDSVMLPDGCGAVLRYVDDSTP